MSESRSVFMINPTPESTLYAQFQSVQVVATRQVCTRKYSHQLGSNFLIRKENLTRMAVVIVANACLFHVRQSAGRRLNALQVARRQHRDNTRGFVLSECSRGAIGPAIEPAIEPRQVREVRRGWRSDKCASSCVGSRATCPWTREEMRRRALECALERDLCDGLVCLLDSIRY